MSSGRRIVVAGAGQAGTEAAIALRRTGFEGQVILVGQEPHLPYQRPPLSKSFLKGQTDNVILRPEIFFEQQEIALRRGATITAIERDRKRILVGGETIGYDHLLLALGGRNRRLAIPGADLPGVLGLRTLSEASLLREALLQAKRVAIIGGGFIGLEIAATARELGRRVTVIENLPRLMARSVLPTTADAIYAKHLESGIDIRLSTRARAVVADNKGVAAGILIESGETIEADLVLLAVGLEPNTDLARDAGLAVEDGIIVDQHLLTSDASISAIGDCARFPGPFNVHIRLESVQNAVGQAKRFAMNTTQSHAPYTELPWFWSDQGALRLQIVGLTSDADAVVTQATQPGALVTQAFRHGKLVGVEAINAPAQFVRARRVLFGISQITYEQASALEWSLDRYIEAATA